MKKCPKCRLSNISDSETYCPNDGSKLVLEEVVRGPGEEFRSVDQSWQVARFAWAPLPLTWES
jgi:hypothetical protein